MIDRNIHREGQVFCFEKTKSIVMPGGTFLIIGKTYHEESNQEMWRLVDLSTGEESLFSEDFLKIKEGSRLA